MIRVSYEGLLADREGAVAELASRLGLDVQPHMIVDQPSNSSYSAYDGDQKCWREGRKGREVKPRDEAWVWWACGAVARELGYEPPSWDRPTFRDQLVYVGYSLRSRLERGLSALGLRPFRAMLRRYAGRATP